MDLEKFLLLFLLCVNFCKSLSSKAQRHSPPSLQPLSCLALGLDYGTSGVRSCVIDSSTKNIVHECSISWQALPNGGNVASSESWAVALQTLTREIPLELRKKLQRICISGTSSSALIYDSTNEVVSRAPRLYNYSVVAESSAGQEAMEIIRRACPSDSGQCTYLDSGETHFVESGKSLETK